LQYGELRYALTLLLILQHLNTTLQGSTADDIVVVDTSNSTRVLLHPARLFFYNFVRVRCSAV
jgi:hypothetical protein